MAQSLTVGLPRSLIYHKHHVLWTTLLRGLGYRTVVSPPTTRSILAAGCRAAVDETCLSVKIHLGHVAWLSERCDAIFLPRYVSVARSERECVKMWAISDIARNAVHGIETVGYSVDAAGITHERTRQTKALYRVARSLGASRARAARAIASARLAEARAVRSKRRAQARMMSAPRNRPRILVVGHAYNLFDEIVGTPIIEMLRKQDCDVFLSEYAPVRASKRLADRLSPGLYWTNNQQLLGAVEFYREKVDGIIFLVTFPCGPDSLVTEMAVRKIRDVPTATLVLDEHVAEAGIKTRLESFVDIIRMQRGMHQSASDAVDASRSPEGKPAA